MFIYRLTILYNNLHLSVSSGDLNQIYHNHIYGYDVVGCMGGGWYNGNQLLLFGRLTDIRGGGVKGKRGCKLYRVYFVF